MRAADVIFVVVFIVIDFCSFFCVDCLLSAVVLHFVPAGDVIFVVFGFHVVVFAFGVFAFVFGLCVGVVIFVVAFGGDVSCGVDGVVVVVVVGVVGILVLLLVVVLSCCICLWCNRRRVL